MTRLLTAFWLSLLAICAGAAAQAQSYLIQPGDVLQVEVLEDSSLNRNTLVLPDGRISIPLAGAVQAGGRTVEQVQDALATKLLPNFAARPNVFVSVTSLAGGGIAGGAAALVEPISIFVLGEVPNPGKLAVEPGTTLLQVFSQMGGFSNFAATKRIQLRRAQGNGAEKIYTLNFDAIRDGTSKNGLVTVADGDVILVPQRRLFE